MSAYTSRLAITFLFPPRPAADLRAGDLLHLGSLTFVLVTHAETTDGWVQVTLYDPDRPDPSPHRVAHLSYRPEQDVRIAHRGIHPPRPAAASPEPDLAALLARHQADGPLVLDATDPGRLVANPAPDDPALGSDTLDLDRVADLVRAAGVWCVVDVNDASSGVATLLAGPPTGSPSWAHPWKAWAGPGRHHPNGPATASMRTLTVGPHDGGETAPVLARSVGAVTEEHVAALIVAQTRTTDAVPTGDELTAIGLYPVGDLGPNPS